MTSSITFDSLPEEIRQQVFGYLDLSNLATGRKVCKQWRTTLTDPGFMARYVDGLADGRELKQRLPGLSTQRLFALINPPEDPDYGRDWQTHFSQPYETRQWATVYHLIGTDIFNVSLLATSVPLFELARRGLEVTRPLSCLGMLAATAFGYWKLPLSWSRKKTSDSSFPPNRIPFFEFEFLRSSHRDLGRGLFALVTSAQVAGSIMTLFMLPRLRAAPWYRLSSCLVLPLAGMGLGYRIVWRTDEVFGRLRTPKAVGPYSWADPAERLRFSRWKKISPAAANFALAIEKAREEVRHSTSVSPEARKNCLEELQRIWDSRAAEELTK